MSKLQMQKKIDPICECAESICVHNNGSHGCDCSASEGCIFQFVEFHNDPEKYEREIWSHHYDCHQCGIKFGNIHHYPCAQEHCSRCGDQLMMCDCIEDGCILFPDGEKEVDTRLTTILKKINTKKYFMGTAVNLQDVRPCLEQNVSKSKQLALLKLPKPVTSYIDYWVSDTVRKIWEPRIESIAKAWKEIEILSVSDGLRDGCSPDFSYNHELLSLADRHPELSIFLSRQTRSITNLTHDVGITRRDSKIPFKKIEILDIPLGYPSCCYDCHYDCLDTTISYVWEAALKVKDANDNFIEIVCAPEVNFPLDRMGLHSTPHIPCSFNCEKSISQGRKYMNIGRKYGFQKEMDWLKEILSWPIEWSLLEGVETVKTPFFRISDEVWRMSKKDPRFHKKYVVRLNNGHDDLNETNFSAHIEQAATSERRT